MMLSLIECLSVYPENISEMKESLLKYLEDGRYDSRLGQGFTDAYFFNPAHIESFMSRFKLDTQKIMAVEGPGMMVEQKLMGLPEEDFQSWLDVLEAISGNREVWGSCPHLLYIGRKRDE